MSHLPQNVATPKTIYNVITARYIYLNEKIINVSFGFAFHLCTEPLIVYVQLCMWPGHVRCDIIVDY